MGVSLLTLTLVPLLCTRNCSQDTEVMRGAKPAHVIKGMSACSVGVSLLTLTFVPVLCTRNCSQDTEVMRGAKPAQVT